jgi:16S rRNA processing protein RimM
MSDDLICVGSIGGSYGVHGELRIKSYCAVADDIETYSPLTREDGTGSFTIAIVRPIKSGFVIRMPEITTKEQADALKGVQLFARRAQLPNLPDDEYYHSDLMGLQVLDTGGENLGKVKSVQNHGAGDLIEVQLPDSSATVLVPFTLAVIPTVDLEAGRIIADPPEGLF